MVSIGDIPGLALILIVTGITLGLGVLILSNFKNSVSDATANSTVDNAISGLSELGDWLDTIALVIAAVIIIGLVLLFRAQRV